MRTISLFNHKGGVGKTTTAVNLACSAAKAGYRTLLWDLDAQGSASFYLGVRPKGGNAIDNLLKAKQVSQKICATKYDHLFVIPADLSLRFIDMELADSNNPKKKISRILGRLAHKFDLVFVDVPPGLSRLSDSVLRASDLLVSPLIPTPLSTRAWQQVLAYLRHEGFEYERTAPFFTMVDRRKTLHRNTIESHFSQESTFLRQVVPYSSDIERMGTQFAPVSMFAPRSVGGLAYAALWDEVHQRIRGNSVEQQVAVSMAAVSLAQSK